MTYCEFLAAMLMDPELVCDVTKLTYCDDLENCMCCRVAKRQKEENTGG